MPSSNRNGKRKTSKNGANNAPEPVAARILQAIILLFGVILLFSVFFGGRWGPALAGGLTFGSAFPPLNKTVDSWLLGKKNSSGAKQAGQIRMVVGGLLTVLSLSGVFL